MRFKEALGSFAVIETRFEGPPGIVNGGYAAGLLLERMGIAEAEVVLRHPIVAGKRIRIGRHGNGLAVFDENSALLVEAQPAQVVAEPQAAPSWQEAEDASLRNPPGGVPIFPNCFSCGPLRRRSEALRILCGALRPGEVAAPWTPSAWTAGADGSVRPPYVLAAIDCPGVWAAVSAGLPEGDEILLLGTMAIKVLHAVVPGRRHVVSGRLLDSEGRRVHAATTLYEEGGRAVAVARQVWIRVERQDVS